MNACPICFVRFTDSAPEPHICHRCGAELTPLWETIRWSQQWLQKACGELIQGDWPQALNSLAHAQGFRRSDLAQQLELFCREQAIKHERG